MKPILPLLTLLLAIVGCKDVKTVENPLSQPVHGHDSLPPVAAPSAKAHKEDVWPVVHEFYADSTHIGIKGKNKIEVKCISTKDSTYAEIKLYRKENRKWTQKQLLTADVSVVAFSAPKYTDFNNDGCGDLLYSSVAGARGANDIQSLFIFVKTSGMLRRVKNSEEYPNLQYNRKLKCIDAWAIYGGSTSYFLTLDADTLRPFASISAFNGRLEVYRHDKKGKETLLKQKASKDDFIRFKNFDPLEEYTEKDYK